MQSSRAGKKVIFGNVLCELNNAAQIRGITEAEVMDYAKSAGGRFVRLRYNGEVASGTIGFQMGVLTISGGRGGAKLQWDGKKTFEGKTDKTGKIKFKPDKLGVLWAYVPAFEHNMKLLAACHSNSSADWKIVDEQDKKEIEKLVDRYVDELGWTREKTVKRNASSFRKLVADTPKADEPPKTIEPAKVETEKAEPATEVVLNEPIEKRKPGRPKMKTE